MLNKVLAAWNSSTRRENNHELELRYKNPVTEEMAKRLSAGGEVKYTVDLISPFDGGQYVATAIFDNPAGTATARSSIRKKYVAQGVHNVNGVPFRVSYTIEEDVEKSIGTATICRVKKRYSKRIGDWRLDVTRVGKLEKMVNSALISSMKSSIFADKLGEFEIELEYLGGKDLTEDDIVAAAISMMSLIDPLQSGKGEYIGYVNVLARHLGMPTGRSLKQTINAAISLTKNDYYSGIFPPTGYYATDKAEGVRAILICTGGNLVCLTSDGMYKWPCEGSFICDAEFLRKENLPNDGGPPPAFKTNADLAGGHFLIFDVLKINNADLQAEAFSERVKHLEEVAKMVKPLPATAKKYVRLGDVPELERQLRGVLAVDYETDGIILTTSSQPYSATKNYKWKPSDKCSIDFLVKKSKTDMDPYRSRPGKTTYLLFVGISHTMRESIGLTFCDQYRDLFPNHDSAYYPIQFSPAYNKLAYIFWHERKDLDGKIVELTRGEDDEWQMLRVRDDRSQETLGCNDYRIAEATYLNFIDPFDIEHLWASGQAYFENIAGDDYKAGNSYRRVIISNLIRRYCSGVNSVIDMAAGRGADLHRYSEVGVKRLFCADIDQSAIAELIRRRYELSRMPKKKTGGGVLQSHMPVNPKWFTSPNMAKMDLSVHLMDFLQPAADNLAKTAECGVSVGSVDAVICNFAFHYFCGSIESMTNALQYAYDALISGGVFVATMMDGKLVYKKFTGGRATINAARRGGNEAKLWQLTENGQQKYAIRREFEENKLAPAGQNIAVKLPFAKEMREEPMANVDTILEVAKRMGFKKIEYKNFAECDDEVRGAKFYSKLTEADKEYIGIHCYIVLKK